MLLRNYKVLYTEHLLVLENVKLQFDLWLLQSTKTEDYAGTRGKITVELSNIILWF